MVPAPFAVNKCELKVTFRELGKEKQELTLKASS